MSIIILDWSLYIEIWQELPNCKLYIIIIINLNLLWIIKKNKKQKKHLILPKYICNIIDFSIGSTPNS